MRSGLSHEGRTKNRACAGTDHGRQALTWIKAPTPQLPAHCAALFFQKNDRTPMLDQAAIARLVARFYGIVRADALLGPIFAATVKDWPEHERRLTAFWCTVALRDADDRPAYHGSPMAAHRPLPIDDAHFEHWLTLWRETCRAQLDAEDAAKLIGYAEGIARGLRYGLGLRGRRLVPRIDRPPA